MSVFASLLPDIKTVEIPDIAPGPRELVACDIILPYHEESLPWALPALESVLNQASAHCTIHLVADAVDESRDPLRRWLIENRPPDVLFYKTHRALGPYRITNLLVEHLKTDFIAIQDSDDFSLPNRIWHSVTALKETGADIFGGRMEQFVDWQFRKNPALQKRAQNFPYHPGDAVWDLMPFGIVINGTMVCRKKTFEALNGFDDVFSGADVELYTRALKAGVKTVLSPEIVGLRRLRGNSLSNGTAYGLGSDFCKDLHARYLRQYENYQGGFDARQWGGLEKTREQYCLEMQSLPKVSSLTKTS